MSGLLLDTELARASASSPPSSARAASRCSASSTTSSILQDDAGRLELETLRSTCGLCIESAFDLSPSRARKGLELAFLIDPPLPEA